jgi:hypothetical protein
VSIFKKYVVAVGKRVRTMLHMGGHADRATSAYGSDANVPASLVEGNPLRLFEHRADKISARLSRSA